MKQEIKKLWVEALRSGEYSKGTKGLRNADNFCCLGVLSDLHRKLTGEGQWVVPDNTEEHFSTYECNKNGFTYANNAILIQDVMDWAGLDEPNPEVKMKDHIKMTLSVVNDYYSNDFNKIADLIEEQL